jgi:hypothetical protein
MKINMEEAVTGMESILHYNFKDASSLWEALQAPGSGVYYAGSRRIMSDGNKRLALKGDAAMTYEIVQQWYSRNLPRGKTAHTSLSENSNYALIYFL